MIANSSNRNPPRAAPPKKFSPCSANTSPPNPSSTSAAASVVGSKSPKTSASPISADSKAPGFKTLPSLSIQRSSSKWISNPPSPLGRRYDLAVCLEVAEHLSPAAATGFVDSLVAHADHILFSAAVPFQGGHHHLNEQLLSYWIAHFARHDYIPLDLFRARLWIDQSIPWWLRQNLILFVRRTALESNPALLAESKINRPLAIIHPDLYLARLQSAHQVQQSYAKLMTLFQQGGNFSVHRTPDGNLNISRLP